MHIRRVKGRHGVHHGGGGRGHDVEGLGQRLLALLLRLHLRLQSRHVLCELGLVEFEAWSGDGVGVGGVPERDEVVDLRLRQLGSQRHRHEGVLFQQRAGRFEEECDNGFHVGVAEDVGLERGEQRQAEGEDKGPAALLRKEDIPHAEEGVGGQHVGYEGGKEGDEPSTGKQVHLDVVRDQRIMQLGQPVHDELVQDVTVLSHEG
mmetsp:Transcript_69145/g.162675  ORF Transcript_69145/g.162675 Transcript_69145/m.162675 type:complete len:205 (+) Transcript_69145:296-910(+)